jgi:hypothetical protein
VALELAKAQAVARTERRLVGDFLDALLEGELSGEEVRRRLRFLGLGASPAIAVLVARRADGDRAEPAVEALRLLVQDRLSRRPAPYVCSIQDASVVALFEAAGPAEARAAAEAVAKAAQARGLAGRFGLGMPEADPRGLRRAYQEARFALEAAGPTPAGEPAARVATVGDLGSHRLLLARQEDIALEAISRGQGAGHPPPHPARPYTQGRRPDGPRPRPGRRPGRVLARPAGRRRPRRPRVGAVIPTVPKRHHSAVASAGSYMDAPAGGVSVPSCLCGRIGGSAG